LVTVGNKFAPIGMNQGVAGQGRAAVWFKIGIIGILPFKYIVFSSCFAFRSSSAIQPLKPLKSPLFPRFTALCRNKRLPAAFFPLSGIVRKTKF
jgi:hypothetical protein